MNIDEYNRVWARWQKLLPMILLPLLSLQMTLRTQAEEPNEAENADAPATALGGGESLQFPGNIKDLTIPQIEITGPEQNQQEPVTWRLDSSTQQYFQAAGDDAIADEAQVSVEDTLPRVQDLRQQGVLQAANVAYFPADGETDRIVHVRSYLFQTPGAAKNSEIFQDLQSNGQEIASTGSITRLHRETPPTATVLWGNALVVAHQDFAGEPVYRHILAAYVKKLEEPKHAASEESAD